MMLRYTLALLPFLLFFSCVPMKQYQDLQKENEQCQSKRDSLHDALDAKTVAMTELEGDHERVEKENAKLKSDTTSQGTKLRDMKASNSELTALNQSLIQKQTKQAQDNALEAQEMLASLQITREDLQKREDALSDLADSLQVERGRLMEMEENLVAKTKEVAERDELIQLKNVELQELSDIIRKKDSLTHALRTKIASALLGFEGAGLTIIQRNGKVYISLDESLLFQVGQSKVAPKGVEALQKLAAVLEANKDMEILVEGHTDNTGSPTYNWKLSTERALSITHILLSNSSIDPARVTAAGRGQFSPIDTADTPEARKKNRRSEIILTPNLDELFNIIDETSKVEKEVDGVKVESSETK